MKIQHLVFCSVCIALSVVTSFFKLGALPFGGSITLFSMFFISLTGYLFGIRAGIASGVTYGILSFVLNPYVFAPIQVLLDYPLAFGALGLSGIFQKKKYYGLIAGYALGVTVRYLFHVLSGYLFFASFAPENTHPLLYTLGYNLTYILPEMILTIVVLCLPAVKKLLTATTKQFS